ncbi:MAG: AsnC family transcriptional regulator [Alphaproteobacteria bacterium]|nr:MAG: AsnC family transcriptional regulator [Alphaproteobacteria bacterium]
MAEHDALNENILLRLARNSRLSAAALAREFDVHPATVVRRLQQLRERGVFDPVSQKVNLRALGFDVEAFIGISLIEQSERALHQFEALLESLPAVIEYDMVQGRFDYIVRIALKRHADLQGKMVREILGSGFVEKSETWIKVPRDGTRAQAV